MRRVASIAALVVLWLCPLTVARAGADDLPVIQFDPLTKAFSSLLPYRAPFTLDVPAPKAALSVGVWFWASKAATCEARAPKPLHFSGKAQAMAGDASEKHFQVTLPALHAAAGYCVSVEIVMPWTAEDNTRVVAVIADGVARLAARGNMRLDAFAVAIGTALGSDADALVLNRPGAVTVKQAIKQILWGAKKSDVVLALEISATRYNDARRNLQKYAAVLRDFESKASGAGGALEASVKDVIALLEAAKLDVAGGDPAAVVAGAAATMKTAVGLLERTLRSVEGQECGKLTDAKARTDCDCYQQVRPSANAPMLRSGSGYLDAAITRANDFATSTQDLAQEVRVLVSALVVPSVPAAASAANPSYTDAAPLYISGDVGITTPLFVNSDHWHGADAVLYVAASISLVAVDKDVPLAKEGDFLRRFSLVGGFTLGEVRNSDGSITGVFGGKGVLAGAGLRITDYVRVGAGAVILRQSDTNKLISDTHVRVAPYLSLSIDLDVAGLVTGMFTRGAGLRI